MYNYQISYLYELNPEDFAVNQSSCEKVIIDKKFITVSKNHVENMKLKLITNHRKFEFLDFKRKIIKIIN